MRRTPEERREYNRLKSARRYAAQPAIELARVLAYKKAHPDKNCEWTHRRRVRMAAGCVLPVDVKAIKASRKTCLYCGCRLTPANVTIDHVVPVHGGGEHAARNIVACCMSCNSRKQHRPLVEWLGMLSPKRRAIVERLIERRNIAQAMLPLAV